VAYNNETDNFELGAAELSLNLHADENSFITSVDFSAGQFDVPFGIDFLVYPSIDRKLVTPPLVVERTHDSWNDFGIKLSLYSNYVKLVVFGVNGFDASFEVVNEAQSQALGVDIGDEIDTSPANTFGARLGLTPVADFELGGSVAFGLNDTDEDEMILIGGDVRYQLTNLSLKGEYIYHSFNRSIADEENEGYYIQALYGMDPVFWVGRYGAIQPDGEDWTNRFTLGIGYTVTETVELRFETIINEDSDENTNILQLVAGF